jgi:hypothetical protein
LEESRHVRLNVILRRKNVKKFFLVFLVLLVGLSGLSAVPLWPGGADDTPQGGYASGGYYHLGIRNTGTYFRFLFWDKCCILSTNFIS